MPSLFELERYTTAYDEYHCAVARFRKLSSGLREGAMPPCEKEMQGLARELAQKFQNFSAAARPLINIAPALS